MKRFTNLVAPASLLICQSLFSQGVGINVTSPQSMLDVEGNVAIGASYSGSTAAPTNGAIIEGNVGIGTSSPGAKLHVAGTGNILMLIESTDNNAVHLNLRSSSTNRRILARDGSNNVESQLAFEDNGEFSFLGPGGTDRVDILSTGQVGILEPSPDAMLEVSGEAGANDFFMLSTDDDDNGDILIVKNSGSVGIGTSSPAQLLHVAGTGNILPIIESTDNNAVQLLLKTNSTNRRIVARDGSDNVESQIVLGDNGSFNFYGPLGTDDRLDILSTGHVGIKEPSPDALIEVSGESGSDDYLMLSSDDNNDGDILIVKNSGNVGIGTTGPTTVLDVNGTVRLRSGATNNYVLTSDASGNATWQDPNSLLSDSDWTISGANIYNSNAGNVGVGSATPGQKLDVVGNTRISGTLDVNTTGSTIQSGSSGVANADFIFTNELIEYVGTTWPAIKTTSNANLAFTQNINICEGSQVQWQVANDPNTHFGLIEMLDGSEATAPNTFNIFSNQSVRINSYGGPLEVYSEAAGTFLTPTTPAGIELEHANSFVRMTTADNTGLYGITGGDLSVRTAQDFYVLLDTDNNDASADFIVERNSTTAGSGTELFRIVENGDVGVGTNNPAENVHVYNTSNPAVRVGSNVSSGELGYATSATSFSPYSATNDLVLRNLGGDVIIDAASAGGDIRFGVGATPSERMTVESTGDIGIGTNNPTQRLDVIETGGGAKVAKFQNNTNSNTADGIIIQVGFTGTMTTGNDFIVFRNGSGSVVGSVDGDGGGNLNYNTTSDRRLKKNITDFENGLTLVDQMRPRKYEYKKSSGVERIGFIAQELQKVFPQAVSGHPNGDPEKDPMSVDYGKLTPVLVGAIQDLHEQNLKMQVKYLEKIESLENKIAELEASVSK